MKKIILVGFGGHARSVVDTIEGLGIFEIVGFLDIPEKEKQEYRGYKVIGTDKDAPKFFNMGVKDAVISLGYVGIGETRSILRDHYKKIGFNFPAIIDKTAIVAKDCIIGEGVFVGKRAVINSNAQVGDMAIINTGVMVEHDTKIGQFSHVAVGAVVCGGTKIGENCFIGANATILQERILGNNVTVGAGAVVTNDIEDRNVVLGIPAKVIKKREK